MSTPLESLKDKKHIIKPSLNLFKPIFLTGLTPSFKANRTNKIQELTLPLSLAKRGNSSSFTKEEAGRSSCIRAFVIICLVFAVISLAPPARAAAPTSGLVGYWNLDEGAGTTAGDSSGSGNNGTLVNGPTWTAGKVGSGAVDFDGVDDYIQTAFIAGPTSGFTFSFWVKTTNTADTIPISWTNYRYCKFEENHQLECSVDGNAPITTVVLVADTWYHVAFTSTASNQVIYINGASSHSQSETLDTRSGAINLGSNSSGTANHAGVLDEVRIYNRALSAQEVQAVYNDTGSGGGPDTTSPVISNIAAANINEVSASISWTTNEPADSQIDYGTTTAYGSSTTINTSLVTTHSEQITGLQSGTTYNYRVRSRDAAGNLSISPNNIFTTASAAPPPAPPPPPTTFYIRDSGTSATCTDWTNACDSLPSVLQRGATYYIADGIYPGYTFDDPASGSTLITIKKATISDHGTNTGWDNSYGDGQAVFSTQLRFDSNDWIFDGNNQPDIYGFRLNFTATRGVDLNGRSNITVRNLHADGGSANSNRGFYLNSAANITIEKTQVSNTGNDAFFIGNASNVVLDHLWVHSRNTIGSTHADFIENQNSNSNVTLRYSRIDFAGQNIFFGGVAPATYINYYIYGNVFFSSEGVRSGASVKALTDHSNAMGSGVYFYNNIVHQLFSAHDIKTAFTGEASNNIYFDLYTGMGNFWDTHTHNYFGTAIGNQDSTGGQIGGNPWSFTGSSLGNYKLNSSTISGQILSSPFNMDPTGLTRGADGSWDRGAYEFVSGSTTPPPTLPTPTPPPPPPAPPTSPPPSPSPAPSPTPTPSPTTPTPLPASPPASPPSPGATGDTAQGTAPSPTPSPSSGGGSTSPSTSPHPSPSQGEGGGAHPQGTLINQDGTIFLVVNGQKSGFRNPPEYFSHGFRFNQAVIASPEDRNLPEGSVQKALDGTLALDLTDNRTIYMIAQGSKRGFTSAEIFFALGYSFSQAIPIDLSDYPAGEVIQFTSPPPASQARALRAGQPSPYEGEGGIPAHPNGALVLDKNDQRTVWWVLQGQRQGFESAEVYYTYGFDFAKIVPANDADMALPIGSLVKFRDGTLVIDPPAGGQATYYIISEGQKRRFSSLEQLISLGYSAENLINASLQAYQEGSVVE